MLRPIIVTACVIAALMFAIKDGRLLHVAGLTGSCAAVARLADGEIVEGCKPGRLEGRPDLTGKSCTTAGTRDNVEYWRCPADLSSSQAGR